MIKALAFRERAQSRGEEIANSVSHGVGLLAAIAAAPFLVLSAVRHGNAARIAGASVFATTMVLLYLTSTLYHALPRNRAKRVFQVRQTCLVPTSNLAGLVSGILWLWDRQVDEAIAFNIYGSRGRRI